MNTITQVNRDPSGWYNINNKLKKMRCYHIIDNTEYVFTPIPPQPDSDILSQFPRLILWFENNSYIVIKEIIGEVHSGWVIGLILGKNEL